MKQYKVDAAVSYCVRSMMYESNFNEELGE